MPSLVDALDAGDLETVGLGESPRRFAHRWDPQDDFDGTSSDFGWIGEDGEGIWMTRHPDLAVDEAMPYIGEGIDLFRSGVKDVEVEDTRTLTEHTLTTLLVLRSTTERDAYRRVRDKSED